MRRKRPKRSPCRLAALVGSLLVATAAGAVASEHDSKARTISVVGTGEVSATPDLALLSVAVETTGRTAEEATRTNAQKSTQVLEAIRQRLGEDDSVKTTRYTLQPQYAARKPGSSGPPEITGYIAGNGVLAECHDISRVGNLLDAAFDAGANRVSRLNFVVEDRNPHVRAALAVAGAEARAQAESIAAALGVGLGEVLTASTSAPQRPVPQFDRGVTMMRAEAASTPVEPGEIKVTATLYVTYRILPRP